MLLTEEDAKTKMCQESYGPPPQQTTVCNAPQQIGGGLFYMGGGAGGVYPYTTSPINCIGSACMAWRWNEAQPYEYGRDFEETHKPTDPGWEAYESYFVQERSGVVKYNRWRRPLPGRKGFCGKAGSPPRF